MAQDTARWWQVNPISLCAVIASIAAALSGAGVWHVQEWRHAAIDQARAEATAEQRRTQEKAASAASTAFEQDRSKNENRIRTVYVQIDKIIDRPVYRSVCVDADGLQLLNRAIGRSDNTSQPGDWLPGPAASR